MNKNAVVLDKNPVVRTAKWVISLIKNKLIASLILLVQGIPFIVCPVGNSTGTVQIGAVIVILACAVNIALHLLHKDKTKLDYGLSFLNALVIATAVFCLADPAAVEPYVRAVAGIVLFLTNAVNLVETLKLEKKRTWMFIVSLIVSIVMMGLGTAMVFAGELKIAFMQQSIGIFLILNALMNIWYLFRLRQAGNRMHV
jgi:uncharacterized membrane protein HdeD (DUF308 family)